MKNIYLHYLKMWGKYSIYGFVIIIILSNSLLANHGDAQNIKSVKEVFIDFQVDENSMEEVFQKIEAKTDYKVFYRKSDLRSNTEKISIDLQEASVEQILIEISRQANIGFKQVNNTISVKANIKHDAPMIPVEIIEQVSVSGTITDEDGEALPGATIQEKGTTNGTITDVEGKFSLSVPEDATLTVSFVGYNSMEIPVNGRSELTIKMSLDIEQLDEIVVIGYGEIKKSDLTGSLSQVSSREVNEFPTTNLLQALSGRAAGVQVIQNSGAPGSNVSIRVRGANSIQGSNEPLYVLNGFPVSSQSILTINNGDIESIEVLKDASATAIYGSRGANGVVLITTKKGSVGKTKIEVEASYGVQTLRKKLDLMNAQEYAEFYNIQAENDNEQPYFSQTEIDNLGEGIDWQDMIFQRAPMSSISVGLSGGSDKTQFSLSGSYLNQDGIIKTNDYSRYSLNARLNHSINEKLGIDFTTTLSRIDQHPVEESGGARGKSLISATISSPPNLNPYNSNGAYTQFILANPPSAAYNPLNFVNEQTNHQIANAVLANMSVNYKPVEGLKVRVSGGVENIDKRNDFYTTSQFIGSQGNAEVNVSQRISLLNENTISYQKEINQNSFGILGGVTYQEFNYTSLSGSGTGFISDASETYDLSAASTPGIPASSFSKSNILSYLGRLNYSYGDKYLATFSFRADGSSKYSPENKWGYFPSGAVAWKVSNEEFFKNIDFISTLKLRASWGVTGSQAIEAYATQNQLSSGKTAFDNTLYTYYAPGTRLPGNLRWETTEQIDGGLDISFVENRIFLTMDYYLKRTTDLLNTVSLPSSLGFTTTIQNVGEVKNYGLEFGVDARILDGELSWNLNANISLNRNEVVKLYDGLDILGGFVGVTAVNDNANILREGRPIGQFWGYVETGYNDNGSIEYLDTDGDGSITSEDKTYIGNPNPDFIYGLNSNITYKNFELSLFIQGVQGNDLFNVSSINSTIDYGNGLNMPSEVLYDHWGQENVNAKYPIISRFTSANVSDRWIEDGSYLRLKNIKLAYNLKVNQGEGNIQFYVSGQNLLTITSYSWWDPEVNTGGGPNSTAIGFDHYGYPSARTFRLGIICNF